MASAVESVAVNEFDGVTCGGEVVAAVDAKKSLVVDGLHSEFD